MSRYLIGGGWDEAAAEPVYAPFLEAAGEGAAIACLLIDEGDGAEYFARFAEVLCKITQSHRCPSWCLRGVRSTWVRWTARTPCWWGVA